MNDTLLGAIDALYAVDDQMGVELFGVPAWNGLKKAVVKHTADLMGFSISKVANSSTSKNKDASSILNASKSISKIIKSSTPTSNWTSAAYSVPSGYKKFQVTFLNGDPLTNRLFGFNDALGNELLGGWWTDLKNGVASATHTVLNAGSKVPYISDAVSDIRSVANIFKKSSSANDSANAVIDSAGAWIKDNKIKIIIGVGGLGVLMYFLLRKKK